MTLGPVGMTDVVVVGAGPAGCAAALACARSGLRVTVVVPPAALDAGVSGEVLTPSESVHPGVFTLLEKLGAAAALETASRGTYTGTSVGGVYTPLGADASGPWLGHHIDRSRFDATLCSHVEATGAQLVWGERVTGLRRHEGRVVGVELSGGRAIHAAWVVDASGRRSVAGQQMAFRWRYLSEPLTVWTGIAEAVAPASVQGGTQFIPSADGWTWFAFEARGRVTWTRLMRTCAGIPPQPPELGEATALGPVRAADVRWRLLRPLVHDGLLLAGDAAGLVDPAAGQGILSALWSGIRAAATVVQCEKQPGMRALLLAEYDGWLADRLYRRAAQLQGHYRSLGIRLRVDASGFEASAPP